MDHGACTAVLDVGKTNAKLSLWNDAGVCVARETRPNAIIDAEAYRALDVRGVENWAVDTLRTFAQTARIAAIIPVTHGAAAVLVKDGEIFAPPMDYEQDIPALEADAYAWERDPFINTGSPRLPCGLNLGAQLHWLDTLTGPWPADVVILPFPQYWNWLMCGVAASEVTSLGVHTDLWRPGAERFSDLAVSRGWASRFAPRRSAGEVLGTVTPAWAQRTGLPLDCKVICGLHDSNAALLAARRHPEIGSGEALTLSTGTWFVALRSLGAGAAFNLPDIVEGQDCLFNVDVFGKPVPSARFMGGREAELIAGLDRFQPIADYNPHALLAALPALLADGAMVLPSFVSGVGPFPNGKGRWRNEPAAPDARRAALELYLALVADESLRLIGAAGPILVEGRFSESEVFVRALAALRPGQSVYAAHAHDDVACGALRMLDARLAPPSPLRRINPLEVSLDSYRALWRSSVGETV